METFVVYLKKSVLVVLQFLLILIMLKRAAANPSGTAAVEATLTDSLQKRHV